MSDSWQDQQADKAMFGIGCFAILVVVALLFGVIVAISTSGDDGDDCYDSGGDPGSAQYERDQQRCIEDGP